MNRSIALAGLLSLAMLAACSKPAPTDQEKAAAAAATAEPAAKPKMGRAEYVTGVLGTIDVTPQCQSFRDQLEQVRNAPSDELSSAEMNQANEIAAQAYAAGCLRKE